MRHPHADIAHEWLEDTSRVVEVDHGDGWSALVLDPMWISDARYRFADDPTRISPPPQVRTYQRRVEIPAALEELPEHGEVWAAMPDVVRAAHLPSDHAAYWLSLGIAYATREEALARRDAMLRTEQEEG